jgi:predicted TIM-barrel fold metal-dependent hydrolase
MNHTCHCSGHSDPRLITRRDFLHRGSMAVAALTLAASHAQAADAPVSPGSGALAPGAMTHPLIDIHAHQLPDSMRGRMDSAKTADAKTDSASKAKSRSAARTEAQFLAHQKAINAIGSVILGGNDYEYGFIKADPSRYVRFASAQSAAGDRRAAIERALKNGARGVGELRYEGDSPFTTAVIELARDFDVPILFHFQESETKAKYADFYRYVEKFPTVKFIGHAIDWWGAIDRNYSLEKGNYPRGRVTPGGLTDQWLTRYPNLYCDLSATSGNTALLRDPDFAKDFVIRHQHKIMFGSDCPCTSGTVASCWAVIKLVALNQLQLSDDVKQKIYLTNAQRLLNLKV